ncbi:CENPB DNA-binding domain-containing protein 1 [Portunus trituberculatus]|uniref:CENPB DNA-binding domain-containing protein 1 n=1 Tax=Portunus trituberculatus TaxID=210409 RepID=A0A5B7GJH8_PORTR|nr:CENPB DNA-binding domain-containing protein 1 [Portunus trituberculatus]
MNAGSGTHVAQHAGNMLTKMGKKSEKTWKVLSLQEKAARIKRLEEGAKPSMLADEMKLSQSTVSTIWGKRDQIKEASLVVIQTGQLQLQRIRDPRLDRMELMLTTWIEDRN